MAVTGAGEDTAPEAALVAGDAWLVEVGSGAAGGLEARTATTVDEEEEEEVREGFAAGVGGLLLVGASEAAVGELSFCFTTDSRPRIIHGSRTKRRREVQRTDEPGRGRDDSCTPSVASNEWRSLLERVERESC